MKSFYIATFGCRTNQADSAALRQDFLQRGYSEADSCEDAEVIVVNSCTVTHRSDQQVRQMARRLRRDNPQARLLVTGCYAQRDPDNVARVAGVDAVVGNTRKAELVQIAESLPGNGKRTNGGLQIPGQVELAAVYSDDFSKVRSIDRSSATQVGGKTRPFVKIQDGCDAKCSYCIIPSVRGPSRSVPPQQVIQQVRDLVEHGFQEIVLTGIHIGTYGMHLSPRYPLDGLLSEIVRIPALGRLRISSIEPMELSRRIIDLAADYDKIAPHFHICLQSGSDRILKRMLRPYNTARFASIVEHIRQRIPDAAIGSDVIVGFPGESEADHCASLDFVRRMPFTYLHVFPYSDRSGTRAFSIREKVSPAARKERSRQFRRLSEQKNRRFRRSFLNKRLSVLTLTDSQDGFRSGVSANYLPVKLDGSVKGNRIVEGKAVREEGEALYLEADFTQRRRDAETQREAEERDKGMRG